MAEDRANNPNRRFPNMWRKGEQPPEHVIDRAVNDVLAERRAVTESVLGIETGGAPINKVTTAMRAATAPINKMGEFGPEPVSGAHLSRADHFKRAAMEYILKLENEDNNG